MKYVVVVSNDELQAKGVGLISHYLDKYPLHRIFGNEFTRVFAAGDTFNLPTGTEVEFETLKRKLAPKGHVEYTDEYLVIRIIRSRRDYGRIECIAQVIERIGFPHTDRIVDTDNRLRILSELYPDEIIIRVEESLKDYYPGATFVVYDGEMCGHWTLTLDQKSVTVNDEAVDDKCNCSGKDSFNPETVNMFDGDQGFPGNMQMNHTESCERPINPEDLRCETLEEMAEREKLERNRRFEQIVGKGCRLPVHEEKQTTLGCNVLQNLGSDE